MKSTLSPVHLIVDSAAMLISVFAWMFIFWFPLILVVAPLVSKRPEVHAIYYPVLLLAAAITCAGGFLLKYLSNGIIRRIPLRIVFSILLLGLSGLGMGMMATMSILLAPPMIERSSLYLALVEGFCMMAVAGLLGMGLTQAGRRIDDQR